MADQKPTIIETGSGGTGFGLALLAIAIVIAAVVAFMFLRNDTTEKGAITSAAQSVGDAADTAKDAVKKNN